MKESFLQFLHLTKMYYFCHMNTKLLLFALLPLLILGSCTKETTETNTTTVNKPYVAPTLPFWGLWLEINSDPLDTSKNYYELNSATFYCASMSQDEHGLRQLNFSPIAATDKLIKFDGNSYAPYEVKGDTLIIYDNNEPGVIDFTLKKIAAGTVTADNWMPSLNVTRRVFMQRYGYSFGTSSSFGIDGDFLYVSHYYQNTSTHKFYKLNTLNGMYVDSANAPVGSYHALHYKASSNKLYNTRYSGSQTMQQRTGLMGANSNLSTNSLSSVRAISTNATSGTVYAFRSNEIYSGSEGGSFSTLFTFTGNYPRGVVYYKADQFLGVYNGTLVLFEISPTFKVIKQYRLVDEVADYLYESISTNGSDIWLMAYDNQSDRYMYLKVTLP